MKVWFDGREQLYTLSENGMVVHYDDAALATMESEKSLPDSERTKTITRFTYAESKHQDNN